MCRLIPRAERAPQPRRRSNRRADWRAGGPLHLPNAHASCNRTSPLCRHSDLLLPSYPAFETRSRRLDGSTRRLRTLTYSTSTTRRRRASHSQRGSRRLRGEVPHRKVEYFTRPRSMEMYILGGSVFHPACPRRLAACKTLASKLTAEEPLAVRAPPPGATRHTHHAEIHPFDPIHQRFEGITAPSLAPSKSSSQIH